MKIADYYEKAEKLHVLCKLCPRECLIADQKRGFCKSRYNQKGVLYTENEYLSALALDPIEKKPLFHYHPGQQILSVGASGCNFSCFFCQNYGISQKENNNHIKKTSEELVEEAVIVKKIGNIGIAYTYSEPVIMYEYMKETAILAQKAELKNVMVSNGYIQEAPLRSLIPYINAFNIDVKAFTEEAYQKHFTASLSEIRRTIKIISEKEKHLEISCLIVPGINDQPSDAEIFFDWLASINREIPVHINRYYPAYQADMPPTSMNVLTAIAHSAKNKMKYVYMGNI